MEPYMAPCHTLQDTGAKLFYKTKAHNADSAPAWQPAANKHRVTCIAQQLMQRPWGAEKRWKAARGHFLPKGKGGPAMGTTHAVCIPAQHPLPKAHLTAPLQL
eukprot:1160969-Pelagomonas_calceolata.AAC.3